MHESSSARAAEAFPVPPLQHLVRGLGHRDWVEVKGKLVCFELFVNQVGEHLEKDCKGRHSCWNRERWVRVRRVLPHKCEQDFLDSILGSIFSVSNSLNHFLNTFNNLLNSVHQLFITKQVPSNKSQGPVNFSLLVPGSQVQGLL